MSVRDDHPLAHIFARLTGPAANKASHLGWPTPSWQLWLSSRHHAQAATGPVPDDLIAIMAARPPTTAPAVPPELSRWQRWRGLFDVGWDPANRNSGRMRFGGMSLSLLINACFLLFLLASLYLRFAPEAPQEEGVRIRITGFGTPDAAGGGEQVADGEPASAAMASTRRASASASSSMASAAATASAPAASEAGQTSDNEVAEEVAVEAAQPLLVSEARSTEEANFTLPPTRILDQPELTIPVPQARPLQAVGEIPGPLPEVRSLSVPERRVADVRTPNIQRAEQEIPEPLQAPQVAIRQLQPNLPAPGLRVPDTQSRDLPGVPAAASSASDAGNSAASASHAGSSGSATAGTAASSASREGLPDGRGSSAQPGQAAQQAGVGPAAAASSGAWPSPQRGTDWGAATENRAGQGAGAAGNQAGQGTGSGLFNADGSPRLGDDRFKARTPNPYEEGSWLRRPGLAVKGTMFDGIWRPPESLLQEWVRRGVKSIDIPLPGGKVKIRCTISILQAGGGCLPVAGENGVHDQPARARAAPSVPFKPALHEAQEDLATPIQNDPRSGKQDDEW